MYVCMLTAYWRVPFSLLFYDDDVPSNSNICNFS